MQKNDGQSGKPHTKLEQNATDSSRVIGPYIWLLKLQFCGPMHVPDNAHCLKKNQDKLINKFPRLTFIWKN